MTKPRLLIIEPDPEIRGSLAAYFEASFEVEAVGRGDEGLRRMEVHPADVVLAEIDLPGEYAPGVLAEIRSRWPHAALVSTYYYGDRLQRLEPLLRRLADVLVMKPLELAKLERTLVSLCRAARKSDAEAGGGMS
jgi:DNA-binding response OmpR family regulator